MSIYTTEINGLTMQIRTDRYVCGNRFAVEAYSLPGGEYYDDLSVNLPDHIVEDDKCFFVKADSFSRDLVDHLVDCGVIEKTCMEVYYGNFGSVAHQYRWVLD